MSVYSEEVSQVENPEQITENGFEDVSLEDNILNIEENVYSATASTSSTSEEITVLPDGIYAFQLKGSNMFMKSENAYPESGDNMAMAQYSGNNVPYMRGAPVATFKITRRESSGTYIIRLMTDESLTIAFDGTNVVTKSISTIDSIVALRNTFYITKHSDGYSIRPYSSSDYISATSDHSGVTAGALSDNAKWYIRGYRTFIEEGVYALENLRNTGMWMDTYFNSYERNKNAQQYDYSSSPADSFSRGGLFKVTKTAVDGQYVIRLMTNNLLTWEVQSDNYVKSDYISYDEDEIELNQKYYIVFDNGGFIVVPCNNINKVISALEGSTASGSAGGDDARLRAVQRSEATNSARWKLHKYTGEDDSGAKLIVPSAFEDTGAIVGNSYTVTPVIWHTDPDKNMYGITDNGNVSNISIDTVNHIADIYVHNPGKLALEVNIRHLVLGIPVNDTWNYFNYNSVPKEGIYYLQNCYSKKYANVLGPSHDEGKIIHQWEYHTAPQARWQVEHVEGSRGYIRFKSLYSNKYLSVDPNDSILIKQYETPGNNSLWRFEALDNGAVKIICKASESSSTVLSIPADRDGNGEWLTQRAYTEDDNYSDEWYIHMFRDASFIALPENYDRSSFFSASLECLENIGYSNNLSNKEFISLGTTKDKLLGYMSCSRITLVRTHGSPTVIEVTDGYLETTDLIALPTNYLSYSELIIYGACQTGLGGKMASNLVAATINAGARTVIGFQNIVDAIACNEWCAYFFQMYSLYYYDSSKTLNDVCIATDLYARENIQNYEYINDNGEVVSLKNFVIAGATTFP